MPKTLTRLIVLTCAASLVACSSLRTVVDRGVAPTTASDLSARPIAPNDSIVLTTTDGKQVALNVTAVTADTIEGVPAGDTNLRHVPLDQVVRIERRETDFGRTAFVVLAIALGIYAVVAAAAASAQGAILANL
jgi:hypothetical protein